MGAGPAEPPARCAERPSLLNLSARRSPSGGRRTGISWPVRPRLGAMPPMCMPRPAPGGVDDRPVLGRDDDGLRAGRPCSARASASPPGAGHRRRHRPRPAPPGPDPAGQLRRQPATGVGGLAADPSSGRLPGRSTSTCRPGTSVCGGRSTASRSSPTTRPGWLQDCYEATTSRSLEQRLARLVAAASSGCRRLSSAFRGLDSTHALIVAAKACDRLGLPRTHVLAFTLPGFATSEHTRTNATALSEALGVTFETIDITAVATQLLRDLGHPAGRGEPAYDVTFENVQAGCAPTCSSARPTSAAGSSWAPGTCPVGPGVVHLWRR